jgi:hypothetical protein
MNNSVDDEGIIEVLLHRMEKQRLPRLLALKEKVDSDELLDDLDLDFLEQAMTDAMKIGPLIDRHPEYQHLASQIISIYKEISDKALKKEQSSQY